MNDTIKYFERKLRSFERNLVTADQRGDTEAIQGLRTKMEHFRNALKALREVEKDD